MLLCGWKKAQEKLMEKFRLAQIFDFGLDEKEFNIICFII